MVEPRSPIEDLLKRARWAGISPALVAGWGRVAEKWNVRALGSLSLGRGSADLTENTWFDLASLTKPLVTTTLCLVAFRSGEIGPATKVGAVLTELEDSWIGSVTVENLLTHTSGLPAWLPLYAIAEGRREMLLPRLARLEVKEKVTPRVIYSCVGFVVLGLLLERLAGETLDRLFQREVTAPLNLEDHLGFNDAIATHSHISGASLPAVEMRLVTELGFDRRWIPPMGDTLPDDGNARFLDGVAGNAGLFGTAHGVATLASEYLPGGGKLLTAEEAEQATALRAMDEEQGRGWGWQLGGSVGSSAGPGLSEGAYGHTGFSGVSVWCEPSTRAVLVLLTNRNHPAQRENDLHPLRRRYHSLAVAELTT
jgi:CubicO group peptidase (beta-lactamase class C family)